MNIVSLSGWPSGLRRQTQGLSALYAMCVIECSGPRMWAWVRIPLLTNFFFVLICLYYIIIRKEGNVLFNDAPNTFYLRLYGVKHGKLKTTQRERKPAAATWATLSD